MRIPAATVTVACNRGSGTDGGSNGNTSFGATRVAAGGHCELGWRHVRRDGRAAGLWPAGQPRRDLLRSFVPTGSNAWRRRLSSDWPPLRRTQPAFFSPKTRAAELLPSAGKRNGFASGDTLGAGKAAHLHQHGRGWRNIHGRNALGVGARTDTVPVEDERHLGVVGVGKSVARPIVRIIKDGEGAEEEEHVTAPA